MRTVISIVLPFVLNGVVFISFFVVFVSCFIEGKKKEKVLDTERLNYSMGLKWVTK